MTAFQAAAEGGRGAIIDWKDSLAILAAMR